MPTTPLSSALRSKQKAGKLSNAALAKAIGANVQSVTGVLKGKSVPNATTAPKYAKFLGLSAGQFAGLVKPAAKAKPAATSKKKRTASARVVGKPSAAAAKPTTAKVRAVTLVEAADLAADALALGVHRATDEQRKYIAAVLEA